MDTDPDRHPIPSFTAAVIEWAAAARSEAVVSALASARTVSASLPGQPQLEVRRHAPTRVEIVTGSLIE